MQNQNQEFVELFKDIPWHQRWEIAPGVFTPGHNDVATLLAEAAVPRDLTGQRILDIGAWNGCFTFEAERRGADVLAIGPETADATGFTKLKSYLNAKAEYRQGSIYSLDPKQLGTFDSVICFGVIYHLRHVLLAFDMMRRVCKKHLYLETAAIDNNFVKYAPASDDPRPHILLSPEDRGEIVSHKLADIAPNIADMGVMQFYRLSELANDPTNWFAMNERCLRDLALSSGFRPTHVSHFGHRIAAACDVVPGPPEWLGNSGEGFYYDVITKPVLGDRDVYS